MIRCTMALLVLGVVLMGCPADAGSAGDVAPGTQGAAAAGDAGAGNQGAAPDGSATAGTPPPGTGYDPPTEWEGADGKSVTVSGTVSYTGSQTGTIYVDFVVRDHNAKPSTKIVHSVKLDELGAFETKAPAGFGKVDVTAFIDTDDNGPGPGEPGGGTQDPIEIGTTDVTGISLKLADMPPPPKPGEPGSDVVPEVDQFGGNPPPPPEEGGPAEPPVDP